MKGRLLKFKFPCLFVIFALFAACIPFSSRKDTNAAPPARAAGSHGTLAGPFYAALPGGCGPGEPVTVIFIPEDKTGLKNIRASLYNTGGKKVAGAKFFRFDLDGEGRSVNAALLAPPSLISPGEAVIKIEDGKNTLASLPLKITPRKFASEVIPLNPANTGIRTAPDPEKTREANRLWSILESTGADIWTTKPFITPVPAGTRRSGFFGDRRVYEYSDGRSDTSVHAGIDYAVPRGTEVKACADGKVVLAAQRIVTGGSVIIEHLPGLYSIYYHLDKINVKENMPVQAGDIIGLSGSTGLSTGPHLHWEIRVSTENTDPDVMVSRPLLDKDMILKAISGGS